MHTSDQLIGCKNARWDGSCPRRCAGQGPHRSSPLCCITVTLQGHQFRNSPASYMCNLHFPDHEYLQLRRLENSNRTAIVTRGGFIELIEYWSGRGVGLYHKVLGFGRHHRGMRKCPDR